MAKDSNLTEEQINQINEKAVEMAREELEKRMEKLTQIIEALIKVLGGMVPSGSAVSQGLEILKALIPSKPAGNTAGSPSPKPA